MSRCTNCVRHLLPNPADIVQLRQDVWQVTELFKLLRLVLPVGDIDVALARLLFERLGIDQPPLILKVLLARFLGAVVVFRVRPDADDVRTLRFTCRGPEPRAHNATLTDVSTKQEGKNMSRARASESATLLSLSKRLENTAKERCWT